MIEFTVWFYWQDGSQTEEALTVSADDAEKAIAMIRRDYEPIAIIAVMPFEKWKLIAPEYLK